MWETIRTIEPKILQYRYCIIDRLLSVCLISFSVIDAFGAPNGFDGDDTTENVVLILANGFDICDAIEWAGEVRTSDSAIEKLIYEGSLGAMNTKTASSGPEFCELVSA